MPYVSSVLLYAGLFYALMLLVKVISALKTNQKPA